MIFVLMSLVCFIFRSILHFHLFCCKCQDFVLSSSCFHIVQHLKVFDAEYLLSKYSLSEYNINGNCMKIRIRIGSDDKWSKGRAQGMESAFRTYALLLFIQILAHKLCFSISQMDFHSENLNDGSERLSEIIYF